MDIVLKDAIYKARFSVEVNADSAEKVAAFVRDIQSSSLAVAESSGVKIESGGAKVWKSLEAETE